MRGRILESLVDATFASFMAVLVLASVPGPIGALTSDPSTPSEEQKQTEDRCKFLMENVNATILSLNTEGEITFLSRHGQRFFGYSSKEILGKPMLGTLTPLTGFQVVI